MTMLIDLPFSTSKEREDLGKINIPVFWGGPVEIDQIFILHSSEYKSDSTKNYGNISISQDYNIFVFFSNFKQCLLRVEI